MCERFMSLMTLDAKAELVDVFDELVMRFQMQQIEKDCVNQAISQLAPPPPHPTWPVVVGLPTCWHLVRILRSIPMYPSP